MTFSRSVITSLMVTILLSACGSDSKKIEENLAPFLHSATTGIWSAPAYGLIFDVTDSQHTIYQVTTDYCQKFDLTMVKPYSHQEFINGMDVSNDRKTVNTSIAGLKAPGITAERISKLPEKCATGLLKQRGETGYIFNAQQDLDIFWQTFNEYYAFFGIENVDWNEIYQIADSQINEKSSERELFNVVSEMITPIRDFHVNVINPELELSWSVERKSDLPEIAINEYISDHQLSPPYTKQQLEVFEAYYKEQVDISFEAILSQLKNPQDIKLTDSEMIAWGETLDDYGYLLIRDMELALIGNEELPKADNMVLLASIMDEVIDDFNLLQGVIIDLRYNGGGDDFVSQYIISRLLEKEIHAYSKQIKLSEGRTPLVEVKIAPAGETFSGPIVVLTSASTGSAAEVFALAMKKRPNTITIGEATAGGFSDMLPKTLPHGLFYSLSNEFYLTPDGISYEGRGVPTDIDKAFFTRQQRENVIDEGLTEARKWLNEY